jgi:hypothetical protein
MALPTHCVQCIKIIQERLNSVFGLIKTSGWIGYQYNLADPKDLTPVPNLILFYVVGMTVGH